MHAFRDRGKWRAKYEEEEDTGLSLDLANPDIDKAIQKAMEQAHRRVHNAKPRKRSSTKTTKTQRRRR